MSRPCTSAGVSVHDATSCWIPAARVRRGAPCGGGEPRDARAGAQIVVGADAREHRELLAAQARDAAAPDRVQTDVQRPQQFAVRSEIFADAVTALHALEDTRAAAREPGRAAPRIATALVPRAGKPDTGFAS